MKKINLHRTLLTIGLFYAGVGIKSQVNGNWYSASGTTITTTPTTIATVSPFALKWGTSASTLSEAWADITYSPPFQGFDQKGILLTKLIPNNYLTLVQGVQPIVNHVVATNLPLGNYISTIGITGTYTIIAGVNKKTEPMLWLRSSAPPFSLNGGGNPPNNINFPGYDETKLIVLPNGNTGINNHSPRASIDVLSTAGINQPCAIFAAKSASSTAGNGGESIPGVGYSYTRHLEYVPELDFAGYNNISKPGDHGLFFSDGTAADGTNGNSSLVIAPWSVDNNVGGLRMDKDGNVELRGNLRTTKLTVNAKWWPDFVFENDYQLLELDSVARYISAFKRLPGIPAQETIINEGQDIGALQQLQQQKIEELTLYILEQKAIIDAQEKRLQKLEQQISKLEH